MCIRDREGAQPSYTLEIGAVTDEAPAVVGRSSWMPVIMVPQSFAPVLGVSDGEVSEATGLVFSAAFTAEDHAAAAKDIKAFLDSNAFFETNVYDAAEMCIRDRRRPLPRRSPAEGTRRRWPAQRAS